MADEKTEGKVLFLKDGTEVVVRPMHRNDVDRSFQFFLGLPEEDRKYLRSEVTRREIVEGRIRKMAAGQVMRLVALRGADIVADGSLEELNSSGEPDEREIRLIVARPYRRQGLGMLMARELYALALSVKAERLLARMMSTQAAAQSIFKRLGFRDVEVIPRGTLDRAGSWQDLVVMRCDLTAMGQKLEEFFAMSDWQRAR